MILDRLVMNCSLLFATSEAVCLFFRFLICEQLCVKRLALRLSVDCLALILSLRLAII